MPPLTISGVSMAVPRSRVVDENCSGIYHCISRCVRQAFLLQSADDHRRRLVVAMLRRLCTAFAVDVVSLAVMENHLHLILRTLPEVADDWSDREVAHRWLLVRPQRCQRRMRGLDPDGPPEPSEIDLLCADGGRIATLRKRLSSLSWFMKELKEPIARLFNAAEGRDGRFWQDRFKCRRLLGEASILCCATYVDMNPVAAGIVDDPMAAPFTSLTEHLRRMWRVVLSERQPGDGEAVSPAGGAAPAEPGSAGIEWTDHVIERFDAVGFEAAIPCLRAQYLDEAALEEGSTACDPARIGGRRPAGDRAAERSCSDDDLNPPARLRVEDHGAYPEVGSDRASACTGRRGSPPPIQILGLTLGAYFRRLLALRPLLADQSSSTESESVDPRSGRATASNLRAALDGGTLTNEMLASFIREPIVRGNAIGSKADLAQEAVRRRTRRVLCALP